MQEITLVTPFVDEEMREQCITRSIRFTYEKPAKSLDIYGLGGYDDDLTHV